MDVTLGVVRILIGVLILMTGVMKITVPMLREAWSGQLRLAKLPFYKLTFWLTPVAELAVRHAADPRDLDTTGCGRGVVDDARRGLRTHRGGRPQRVPTPAQRPGRPDRRGQPHHLRLGRRHGGLAPRVVTEEGGGQTSPTELNVPVKRNGVTEVPASTRPS